MGCRRRARAERLPRHLVAARRRRSDPPPPGPGRLIRTEVDPITGQVVPVSAATRQCKTIWEMLGEKGLRSHVVSWFATQGEQNLNGKMVSIMFAHVVTV
jgi:hypothetical protein